MQRKDIPRSEPVCAWRRACVTAAQHQIQPRSDQSVGHPCCVLYQKLLNRYDEMVVESWEQLTSEKCRRCLEIWTSYSRFFSLLTISPLTFAFDVYDKPLSPPSSPSYNLSLLFLRSSDSVAHPFPITLGFCLGPQHDLLYIATLLRLFSLWARIFVLCVCVCISVKEKTTVIILH